MAQRHYGSDKILIGLLALIVLSLLAFWFWGNRSVPAPEKPVHSAIGSDSCYQSPPALA
jgi:hypothetical protein